LSSWLGLSVGTHQGFDHGDGGGENGGGKEVTAVTMVAHCFQIWAGAGHQARGVGYLAINFSSMKASMAQVVRMLVYIFRNHMAFD